jgi:uroporphyrinogen-III synthase
MSRRTRSIVLATASLSGREAFAHRLATHGLSVWPVPVTRSTMRRAAVKRLARVLANGSAFDWLIVTSRRTSAALSQVPMRVAAVGPTTAASIETQGVNVDLVGTGEGAHALSRLILSSSPNRPVRSLWPRAAGADRALARFLRSSGGTVREIALYDTRPRPLKNRDRIERAITLDQVGAVSFFAPSAVRAFVRQLSKSSRTALSKTVVASLGASTSEELRRHGLEPRVEARSSDLGDFANRIASALGVRGRGRLR